MWTRERLSVLLQTLAVALITAATFLGFFYRDFLLIRADGSGSALDVFYIGILLPTLIVNVLLVPFGSALVPHFVHLRPLLPDSGAAGSVYRLAAGVGGLLAVISLFLLMAYSGYADWLAPGFSSHKLAAARDVLMVSVVIMAMGGVVIVLNALLNAAGRQLLTSFGQLSVAMVAIVVVVLFYPHWGLQSAVYGMLFGQLVNLVVLIVALRKLGFPSPRVAVQQTREGISVYGLLPQYLPLVGSALLAGLTIPVASVLVATLHDGSVGLFGFGYKAIVFITGVFNTAIGAVLVPFFASRFGETPEASRRDMSFFVGVITIGMLPVVMGVYAWGDSIVAIMFGGMLHDLEGAVEVGRVVKFGIVQLPFFGISLILTKYLIANHRSRHVFESAILGLVTLLLTGVVLREFLGLGGVAIAASFSVGITAVYLLFVLYRSGHISLFNLMATLVFLMLFVTLSVCLHYASYTGVILCIFSILLLLANNRNVVRLWFHGSAQVVTGPH